MDTYKYLKYDNDFSLFFIRTILYTSQASSLSMVLRQFLIVRQLLRFRMLRASGNLPTAILLEVEEYVLGRSSRSRTTMRNCRVTWNPRLGKRMRSLWRVRGNRLLERPLTSVPCLNPNTRSCAVYQLYMTSTAIVCLPL